eukprot:15154344-Ditylum_brightwellii.AAC.1
MALEEGNTGFVIDRVWLLFMHVTASASTMQFNLAGRDLVLLRCFNYSADIVHMQDKFSVDRLLCKVSVTV